jgi:hypothetical protein
VSGLSNFREAMRESFGSVEIGPVASGDGQLGYTGVDGGHARVASGCKVVSVEKRPERVMRRFETGSFLQKFICLRKGSPGTIFR